MLTMLQLVSVGVNVCIAYTHNTKRIYWLTFAFNLTNLLVYVYLQDAPTIISYAGITLRSLLYVYKDKFRTNALPVLFCTFHVCFGLYTITNAVQLLTIVAPCTVCYYMWFCKDNRQHLRIGNIANAALWLFYNVYTGVYLIAVLRCITIVSNAHALYINHKQSR